MKNKKKLLFCIDTLGGGGAEKLLIDILKRLSPKQYTIALFIIHKTGIYFDVIPSHVNWFTSESLTLYNDKVYDTEIAFLEGTPL